ncbi:MAG: hypothetical protein JWO89_707 [Verrucomicrobiaceae bacterium]|nr:hypothetical protein [Verrucomicrobiaceae bacterium]
MMTLVADANEQVRNKGRFLSEIPQRRRSHSPRAPTLSFSKLTMQHPRYRLAILAGLMSQMLTTTLLIAEDPAPFSDEQVISVIVTGTSFVHTLSETHPKEFETIGREATVIVTARAIMALGEFATTQGAMDTLQKLKKDKLLTKVRCPDWIMFSDEYRHTLRRMGEIRKFGDQEFHGEGDADALFGTGLWRTLENMVDVSIQRLDQRRKDAILPQKNK